MTNIIIDGKGDDSAFTKVPYKHLTGEAKWKDIEDLINRWAKRNRQGAIDNERWVKEAHAELSDKKFGHSANMAEGRIGLSIHPELMQYIETFYPKFMQTKEEMHEFMKRFPKFRVPEQT